MLRKIAVIVILALAGGIAIGFATSQLLTLSTGSSIQEEQQNPVEVRVIEGQIANVTFEDGQYTFTCNVVEFSPNTFYVITPNPISGKTTFAYAAEQGAVYNISGIKITVSEVKSNYIVLLIESNVRNDESSNST